MKNYNHISKMMLSAFAALMLSSCDDYLKETSPDLLIPEKVEEFQSVLNGEGYLYTFTNDADFIHLMTDDITLWTAGMDEELTSQSYIVPGLGDAGDLAFGDKL